MNISRSADGFISTRSNNRPRYDFCIFLSAGRLWKLLSLRKMNPFNAFDQDALLEALTQYYTKYRLILEKDWNEYEFTNTKETLFAILEELNDRQGLDFDARMKPSSFTFQRKAE